jgi:chromosome segregation ATPase
MATLDELENRVRELSTEVEGEKVVTRQVYQQAVRNGDALRAVQLAVVEVTSRADHIVQEVIQNTAAVRTQGARLDSLTRDTGLLRNDLTLLRRDIEATNGRLDQLQADATQIKDSVAAILAAPHAEANVFVDGCAPRTLTPTADRCLRVGQFPMRLHEG